MKIEQIYDDSGAGRQGTAADSDAFFSGMKAEEWDAVCRGLDAPAQPMALVSAQLMVLRQTRACRGLLEEGTFYSLVDVFSPAECERVRQCIRTQAERSMSVQLFDRRWEVRVVPVGQLGALLVFRPNAVHQAGVTMAAARLRESAARLLMRADQMETGGLRGDACVIRREAMRILRQANHTQLLFGAPEEMRWETSSVEQLFARAEEQLARRRVGAVTLRAPSPDIVFQADVELLLSALMTLVSNSLRHGGSDVRITVSAEPQGGSAAFYVDDDGPGIDSEALARMDSTWRRPDATVGGWGLGVPYARRIAELHGGMLVFLPRTHGSAARLLLPLSAPEEAPLEADVVYRAVGAASGVCAADVELSDALPVEAFAAP